MEQMKEIIYKRICAVIITFLFLKGDVLADPSHQKQMLVQVKTEGGLCVKSGRECVSNVMIYNDGSCEITDESGSHLKKSINASDLKELVQLIEETNFKKIKSKPFVGTCPRAYDGSEIIYTVNYDGKNEVISTCTYQTEDMKPLAIKLHELTN
jgi:hypothetical protein